ncbi:unnamed protein product [Plutella xylostella]|uniref:RNA-directed DNA polymerase n=1 Tax=Plutella xylostella TaxID=51655 RepID=A0A8S4G3Q7_PLUXY|nr:unnamed protein product [Plutella xylostella]
MNLFMSLVHFLRVHLLRVVGTESETVEASCATSTGSLLKDEESVGEERGEAAIWWQGVKDGVKTWKDFSTRIRNAFAPKKPAYVIYQDIMSEKQKPGQITERFISQKRMLFAQLPKPEHSEQQQLDMVYGLLRMEIRSSVPRSTVTSFDTLLEAARGAERDLEEKGRNKMLPSQTMDENRNRSTNQPTKVRCTFCRLQGHTIEVCRKKKKLEEGALKQTTTLKVSSSDIVTQAPSPSQPKFSCYGCGAPGVVRSNCQTCSSKKNSPKVENISFCSVNVRTDSRPRPVVYISVDDVYGVAYVDTCAKTSIASYNFYCCLKEKGYRFNEKQVNVTLADGVPKTQTVMTVDVPVTLCGYTIPTTFVVLPESRDNRTLLGIGFIQDAKMVLNLPQFTWHCLENPGITYELYQEDFIIFQDNAKNVYDLKEFQLPSPVTSLTLSEPSQGEEIHVPVPTTSINSVGYSTPTRVEEDATLPTMSAAIPYKLIPIDLPHSPLKRSRTLFDGYSPRMDFMLRDVQMNILTEEVTLSPHSKYLFPDPDSDVDICAIDVVQVAPNLTEEQKKQLEQVLIDHEDVFTSNGQPTTQAEHIIDTGDHPPIAVPPYRLSPPRREILKKEIEQMLESGIITACSSPWAAPVVLVPKPDGQIRLCVDYRRLNAITKPDTYPIPRIDDLLHEAKPTPCMSSIDLKSSYWQLNVRETDREKTAFITPFGIFQFNRMPFGLRNAPATFQRMIDRFRISINAKILAYLDDIIIFSASFEDHLVDLKQVLNRIREYNLTINLKKCRFCCEAIKYLGHYITPQGLKMDPERVSAIINLPPPSNIKHLISFLQTCSWYRRFIENFSSIAEPLTRLTKKNAKWMWDKEQDVAYNELKLRLTSAPILRQADETKPYIIKTDASSYALGAVLVQGEKEEEHPVEYASRLLTPAERNYSTTEREALAVVWALSKFRGYIDCLPITVVTDHQALKWLMSLKSPSGRLARWALQLQAHDLTIKYSPGRTNVVADTLSRPPCTDETAQECGICGVEINMPTRSAIDIRNEQLKDKSLQQIVNILEDSSYNENAIYWSNKGYVMNNGLLYRHNPNVDADDAQLVVPEHEWSNILCAYHDDPLAGHYGSEKTYQRICRRYYWKGMRKYIESYVKNCLPCQRYKPSNQKPSGLLQTTVMNQRFEIVAIDLFGPLPVSNNGMNWIFIIEDVATRWTELFAMENATASNCAMILINEIFLRFGFARRVISDNGTQFVSSIMQQVMYCLRIKHAFTPFYHPESNPVERRNRDLKTQLAILVGDTHRDWPDKLPSIRFAMNTANCSSTEFTPAYMTYGRELRTPDDNTHDLREIIVSENFIPEITPRLLQLADTLKKAREVQEQKEETRKQIVDESRKKTPAYSPGDLVLVTLHPLSKASQGVSAKLCPRRDGPYVITRRHGPASFELASPNNREGASIGVYHASALRPYQSSATEANTVPNPIQPIRKRGRPRKQNPVQANPSPVRRRRGRPRKNTSTDSSPGRLHSQRGRL